MSERLDASFIKRCEEMMKSEIEENIRETQKKRREYFYEWVKENREAFKESQRKYNESEKGKIANARKSENRKRVFKRARKYLREQEKLRIKEFYANRPEGYHVDHIIPISKGGKHRLSNLQYLTPEDNAKKANKLVYICS
jgi:hypothetical protein